MEDSQEARELGGNPDVAQETSSRCRLSAVSDVQPLLLALAGELLQAPGAGHLPAV